MVKAVIYREKLLPELQKLYQDKLKEKSPDDEVSVLNYLTRREVMGLFPMYFAHDTKSIVVDGVGFQYLRKKVGDYHVLNKPFAFLVPDNGQSNAGEDDTGVPFVSKIKVGDVTYEGYIYANNEINRHRLWAFRKAIEELGELYKGHKKVRSPKGDQLDNYGVVGVNIKYEEPAWVTAIRKGVPQHNPAINKNGQWYFGERSIEFNKVARSARVLLKHDEATWKALGGTIYFDGFTEKTHVKSYTKVIKNFLKYDDQTILLAGWDNHARLLVKPPPTLATPSQPKNMWVIDPWMDPARIDASPSTTGIRDLLREKFQMTLTAVTKPADQEFEGSCVIVAFARALWMAREGLQVASRHPIPADYAVLALRLLRPRHVIVRSTMKDETKVRPLFKSIPSTNPIVMRKRVAKPSSAQLLGNVEPLERPCMAYPDNTLLSHQKKVIDFMMQTHQKGIILFHSLGSGKTITAIALSRCLMYQKKGIKMVVATPSSVQKQFEREIQRLAAPDMVGRYKVVTHNGLATHYDEFVDSKTILVIDEAHNFKNPNGILTKGVLRAASEAYKIILLSATPIVNKLTDLAPMLAMANGREDVDAFVKQLSEKEMDPSVLKCKFSYYHTPYDVRNFPSVTERYQTFRMEKEYYNDYLTVQNNEVGEDESGNFTEFKSKHLEKFLNGVRRAANRMGNRPSDKVNWTIQKTASEVAAGRKVVIFTGFRNNGIKIIKEKLDALGIDSVHIDGSVPPKKRGETVLKYNSGELKVLMITMAGAEGLDLKGTSSLIIVDPWWNLGKINQIVGRVVRYQSHIAMPKDQRHVDVYYLVLKKPKQKIEGDGLLSADELMYRLAEYKNEDVVKLYDVIKDKASEHCRKIKQNEI